MTDIYRSLLTDPRVRRFVWAGFIGRVPMSMLGVGTILLVSGRTGSFALAGAVSATMLASQSVTAPGIGRLTDRRGQAAVLRPLIGLHSFGLLAMVLCVETKAPIGLLFAAGVIAGGSFPPIGSLVRARWVARLEGTASLPAAFSLEAAIDELVYILGPLIVAGLIWLWQPAAGLLAALVLTAVGGLAFAALRDTQPPLGGRRASARSLLRSPGLPVLLACCIALGTIIGATEVSLVAFSRQQGQPLAAGPLIALFSVGSVLAGLLYGSRNWQASLTRRFLVAIGALLLSTVPIAVAPGIAAMVASVLVAGCAFSPTLIICYELVDELAPAAALTEAFAWLQTALGAGLAVGSGCAGQAIAAHGDRAGLLLPVLAGSLAFMLAGVLAVTLGRSGRAALPGIDLDDRVRATVASS